MMRWKDIKEIAEVDHGDVVPVSDVIREIDQTLAEMTAGADQQGGNGEGLCRAGYPARDWFSKPWWE